MLLKKLWMLVTLCSFSVRFVVVFVYEYTKTLLIYFLQNRTQILKLILFEFSIEIKKYYAFS